MAETVPELTYAPPPPPPVEAEEPADAAMAAWIARAGMFGTPEPPPLETPDAQAD